MKNTRKRKTKKGDFGYFSSEKKRRLLITAGLFSLPLLVFFVAWAVNGTRMTVVRQPLLAAKKRSSVK